MGNVECCAGRRDKIDKAKMLGSKFASRVTNGYKAAKKTAAEKYEDHKLKKFK
jgi:hypothetical protein